MESDGLCPQFVMEISHENLAIAHLSGIFLSPLLITARVGTPRYFALRQHKINDREGSGNGLPVYQSPCADFRRSEERQGQDRIKPGDQITVIGNRAKNGSTTLRLQKVVLSNGQELDPNSLQD